MMLVVLGMCVSLFTYMALLFAQPYLIRLGKSLVSIGIMYFFFNLAIALSAPLAHVVERKIGERKIVLIIPASFLLCFLFLSVGRFVIPAFIALNVASGFSQPLLNDYLNRRIPTEKRGTVTSFQTALLAAVQLFFEPALGYTSDWFSLKMSFFILSCACVILFLFTLAQRSSLKHPSGEHK
jgi:MFS family permease